VAVPMTESQMRNALRKFGVTMKTYPGRSRPGAFSPVGVVIHHTGSDGGQNSASYDHFLFWEGRESEGIPGALCQASVEMDGDFILGTTGRANHAGKGASNTLALVKGDKAPLNSEISPGSDSLDGNAQYYGFEVKYDGGQPMTAKQYDTAVRGAAAICDFYGWSGQSVIGHREHTRRKNDPGKTAMDKFRRDVDAMIAAVNKGGGTGSTPTPPEGELSVADVQTILTKLDALHEIASGRYVQEIEEARAQSRAALAANAETQAALNKLVDLFVADEAEEDSFDKLTGQRWAQTQDTVNELRAKADETQKQLQAALDKLDKIGGETPADVN
jgi:hypothetical protein